MRAVPKIALLLLLSDSSPSLTVLVEKCRGYTSFSFVLVPCEMLLMAASAFPKGYTRPPLRYMFRDLVKTTISLSGRHLNGPLLYHVTSVPYHFCAISLHGFLNASYFLDPLHSIWDRTLPFHDRFFISMSILVHSPYAISRIKSFS